MEFLIYQEIDLGRVNPVYRYEQPMEHGDGQAHRWCVAIRKDGEAADLTGMSAKCYVTRAANAAEKAKGVSIVSVIQDANVDAEGGTVECTFESGCYAGVGAMKCVMRLYDGAGSAMATAKMTAVLERSTSDAVYDPEGLIPSMEALLAQIATIEAATKNAAEAAGAANTAAERADESAERADNAAQAIEGMTVSAQSAAAPGAAISERNGVKHIVFDLVTPRITFEVETGAAGTNVEIKQSGTPEAPVVKLTIPRGDAGNIDGLDYYEGNPAALGTASPGTANGVARGNHVHPMPTAEQVGARSDTWLPSKTDIKTMTLGTWDGNTTPNDIPFGISYVAIGNLTDGHGFPVGFATVLALKDSVHRLFQLLVEKENGKMYIRSANDGAAWGAWKKYLGEDDTAGNASKLDGKTWAELMLTVYPVGSIYMSVNAVNPGTLFGGTWEQLKDRFLLGAGSTYSNGKTGGAAAVTLTIDQMPKHRHVLRDASSSPSTEFDSYIATSDDSQDAGSGTSDGVRRYTTYEGGGESHNNMPPYLVVYMWKRTA